MINKRLPTIKYNIIREKNLWNGIVWSSKKENYVNFHSLTTVYSYIFKVGITYSMYMIYIILFFSFFIKA